MQEDKKTYIKETLTKLEKRINHFRVQFTIPLNVVNRSIGG